MIAIYCRKCGKELEQDAAFCIYCGAPVTSDPPPADAPETKPAAAPQSAQDQAKAAATARQGANAALALFRRSPKLIIAVLLVVAVGAVGLFSYFNSRCGVSGCNNKAEYGNYCSIHVCLAPGCTNRRASGSGYCYTHKEPDYYASLDLEISNVKIEHNSSYTVATGTVTNNGTHTYTFVKVKGAFQNSSGTTLDTDWIYAVGSEGLASGESTSFRLSVPKDRSIYKCSVSIMDYD